LLSASFKRRVIRNFSLWDVFAKRQALEILWRDVRVSKPRVGDESESDVVAGITEDDAPARRNATKAIEPFTNQRTTDASALAIGPDGNRPETVSTVRVTVDRHRTESDMTDHFAVVFGNERNRERARCSKRVNDSRFGVASVRCIQERGRGDGSDCVRISVTF
jgi:hypothetical protein